MQAIEVGLKGSKEMVVRREHLASAIGNVGAEVLSTHWVVLLMERAARNALGDRLPEGKITLGTGISIRHFAATPVGRKVRAEAFLKRVDGRRLFFHVTVRDEFEKIAEGENEQVIVSAERFLERVKRKMR